MSLFLSPNLFICIDLLPQFPNLLSGPTTFFVPDMLRGLGPGCRTIPLGASDLPSLPTFAFSWLSRLRGGSRWRCIPLPWHECAFQGIPSALGCTPWELVPGAVDYNLHLYPFLGHFSTYPGRRLFSSGTFLGDPGCLKILLVHHTLFCCPLLSSLGSFHPHC